jgi:hypothetical protein
MTAPSLTSKSQLPMASHVDPTQSCERSLRSAPRAKDITNEKVAMSATSLPSPTLARRT